MSRAAVIMEISEASFYGSLRCPLQSNPVNPGGRQAAAAPPGRASRVACHFRSGRLPLRERSSLCAPSHWAGCLNLSWLRRVYEREPGLFALCQASFLLGTIFLYLWAVPVWYWAIYRGGLAVPKGLSDLLYWVWINENAFRGGLIALVALFFGVSYLVRRDSFKELGLRTDNLLASGRECLVVVLAVVAVAVAVVLAFPQHFSFEAYLARGPRIIFTDMLESQASGFVQQFLLQSIFLVCALQIFRNKYAAAVAAAAVFSLIHAPNIGLMALTLAFGLVSCLLFLRHRNVFTLGITHGLVKEVVRVLFVSVLASKTGYYDYNLRVGPLNGKPDYLAYMENRGSAALQAGRSAEIFVPVSVTNISGSTWASERGPEPVFMSYHISDAEMATRRFSGVLTPLGKTIGPEGTALVDLRVKTPSEPGDYLVQVDLVSRPAGWGGGILYFRSKGLKPLVIPMKVH